MQSWLDRKRTSTRPLCLLPAPTRPAPVASARSPFNLRPWMTDPGGREAVDEICFRSPLLTSNSAGGQKKAPQAALVHTGRAERLAAKCQIISEGADLASR